jgi:DNA helicase-2/ATP-dependent DNA helicase PcrA
MTRSKERLYLLRAFRRGFTGAGGSNGPSRFLYEIPRDLITSATPAAAPKASSWETWGPSAATETPPSLPSLKTGDKVHHPTFGEGMVVSCTPSGQDFEVVVAFAGGTGVKRLLLSFAHLEKTE